MESYSKKKVLNTMLIFILLISGLFFLTGCSFGKKTSITASTFNTTMKEKGYTVQDVGSQFSNYNYVKQAYVAVNKDYSYQIEFYELQDDSYATSFYNNNKSNFESSKGNASAETSVALSNYAKYTLSANGKYKVISRIDNTVIYVDVDDNYKGDVTSLLDELGY